MLLLLAVQVFCVFGLVTEIEQKYVRVSSQYEDLEIKFESKFSESPVIMLAIEQLSQTNGVDQYYYVFPYNLTIGGTYFIGKKKKIILGFIIKANGNNGFSGMLIDWVAFERKHGFCLYQNVTDLSRYKWGTYVVQLKYPSMLTYEATYSVFLNGLRVELGDVYDVQLRILSSNSSHVNVEISSSGQSIISWVLICVVVGNKELFFSERSTLSANGQLQTQMPLAHQTNQFFKFANIAGLSGYTTSITNGIEIDISIATATVDNIELEINARNNNPFTKKKKQLLLVIRSGCILECNECSSADVCSKCLDSRQLANGRCLCKQGYFELGVKDCAQCESNCLNCLLSSAKCTECDLSLFRILDTTNNTCVCQNNYYEFNSTCSQCHRTCKTCFGGNLHCTSCYPEQQRILINNICYCDYGFYEDFTCLKCSPQCRTCFLQANNCTLCIDGQNRALANVSNYFQNCLCEDGYYDTVNSTCALCHPSCLTCSQSDSFCTSCQPERNLHLENNKCKCDFERFNYSSPDSLCQDINIELLQFNKLNEDTLEIIRSLRELSQTLQRTENGNSYFIYLLRRTAIFSLIANFDQPIAHFNYINATYPLLVFEVERFFSILIFDNVNNYYGDTPTSKYTLFGTDVDIGTINDNMYNFLRCSVTPLFILTSIEVFIVTLLFLLIQLVISIYKKYYTNQFTLLNQEIITNYRITEDVQQQEMQWVKWQTNSFIQSEFWLQSIANFCYFWVLENKMVILIPSILLQLGYPTFKTPLQIFSFISTLITLLVIVIYYSNTFYQLRAVVYQKQILEEYSQLQQNNERQTNTLKKQQEDFDKSIRYQMQRPSADLKLLPIVYLYHFFTLLKKLLFGIVCVFAFEVPEAQLWILFFISIIFLVLKIILRPYNIIVRTILSSVCDGLFICVLIFKINDFYNYKDIVDQNTYSGNQASVQQFIDQGIVTVGFEIAYMILSFLLQIFIIVTYIAKFCQVQEFFFFKKLHQKKPRELNLQGIHIYDFQRMLIDLTEIDQVKVLFNMSKVFRYGDLILDEFLEFGYIFTSTHRIINKQIEVQGHFTLSIKNMNKKDNIVIYDLRRKIVRQENKKQVTQIDIKEPLSIQFPLELQPTQSFQMHQYVKITTQDLDQHLKLIISYQKVIQNKSDQNLIILEAKLTSGIETLLKNVSINEDDAYEIYREKERLLNQQVKAHFVSNEECQVYWSIVQQFSGFIINQVDEPSSDSAIIKLRQNKTSAFLAKFQLPNIDATDDAQILLDVFLIAEKEEGRSIDLQVWHVRYGQFCTYGNTQLYNKIMEDFLKSIVGFFET